jgi:pentatricopeptide repeat protein
VLIGSADSPEPSQVESEPSTPSPPTVVEQKSFLSERSVATQRTSLSTRTSGPEIFGIPIDRLTSETREQLATLGDVLKRSLQPPGRKVGRRSRGLAAKPSLKEVWKAYLGCRKALVSEAALVPAEVWSALWKILEPEGVHNLDRMAHIKILGADMRQSGVPMLPSQRELYIEAIFVEANQEAAIVEWEDAQPSYLRGRSGQKDYWELGVLMFCRSGELDRALQAAERFLSDTDDPTHFRILIPIIQALASSKDRSARQRAWALYIRLRVNLGPQMVMADYDALTSGFMEADQPDLALGVFRDMMITGDPTLAQKDSAAQYRAALNPQNDLGSMKIGLNELDWENSRMLSELPAKFNNKFFYGSWIRKLLSENQIDAAKRVFNLMQERRIQPDAKHMNGLIGAWFRKGTEKERVLAENQAWQMIKARLDFVSGRETQYKLEGPLRTIASTAKPASKSVSLIPPATIETFCVLIEQYRRRQRQDLIPELLGTLDQAQIAPNADFMNEMLLTDVKTKAHRISWAWETYTSLTARTGVRPNSFTFIILWGLMRQAADPVLGFKADELAEKFTTPRKLFAEMIARWPRVTRESPFSQGLYDEIILSFSLAQDQVGTAVALQAMQRHYNQFPNQQTARTIVLQLSRLGFDRVNGRPRRLSPNSAATKNRIAEVTKIMHVFKSQRDEALKQQGVDFKQLSDTAKMEELLMLLSDVLRYVAKERIAAESDTYTIGKCCTEAAQEMGAPDCVPWATQGDDVD